MDTQYLSLDEIHAILADMLRFVDKICKAEHIQYFLSGGTLLGAVRHHGFIPWDDDVDLMMPRPEFERFLSVAPKYMTGRYSLAFPKMAGDYAFPWIRIHDNHTAIDDSGMQKARTRTLFLDIFPIEGLPTNPRLSDLFFKWIRLHDILLKCARKKDLYPDERLKWLKRPLMALTRIRPLESYAYGLNRAAARFSFDKSKYAGVCVITHYGSRERMPAEVFRGSVDVTFEGEPFPAPIGYDTYLHGLYGDYMTPPPEGSRDSWHNIHARIVSEEDRA